MKILLAVDGSEHSAAAVEEVASRPWPPETTVRVLSAVECVAPPAAEVCTTRAAASNRRGRS